MVISKDKEWDRFTLWSGEVWTWAQINCNRRPRELHQYLCTAPQSETFYTACPPQATNLKCSPLHPSYPSLWDAFDSTWNSLNSQWICHSVPGCPLARETPNWEQSSVAQGKLGRNQSMQLMCSSLVLGNLNLPLKSNSQGDQCLTP